jgi:RHS repeat-associated protein
MCRGGETADGTLTLAWNGEERLTATAGVGYTHDGDGWRVKKDQTSGSTYDKLQWRSLSGDILFETDLAGNNPTEYIYFAGKRIARRDNSGTVYYFLQDHLGSTRIIANASGGIVRESDYYPFGGERLVSGTVDDPHKFAGMYLDGESGLYYTWFRMYDPTLGRWLAPDPIAGDASDPGSLNRYAYVLNNPVNFIDPLGLDTCTYGPTGPVNCPPTTIEVTGSSGPPIHISSGPSVMGTGSGGTTCTLYDFGGGFVELICDGRVRPLPSQAGRGGGSREAPPDKAKSEKKGFEDVWQAAEVLRRSLILDPDCLTWLGARGARPLEILRTAIFREVSVIDPTNPNARGASAPELDPSRLTPIPAPIDVQMPFSSFARSEQMGILIHELAHNTGVIYPNDAYSVTTQRQNRELIEKNCSKTLKRF